MKRTIMKTLPWLVVLAVLAACLFWRFGLEALMAFGLLCVLVASCAGIYWLICGDKLSPWRYCLGCRNWWSTQDTTVKIPDDHDGIARYGDCPACEGDRVAGIVRKPGHEPVLLNCTFKNSGAANTGGIQG